MRLLFFAIPSMGYSAYLAGWLWLKVWQPQSAVGWCGMAALWLASTAVVVGIHFVAADVFILSGEQSEFGPDGFGRPD